MMERLTFILCTLRSSSSTFSGVKLFTARWLLKYYRSYVRRHAALNLISLYRERTSATSPLFDLCLATLKFPFSFCFLLSINFIIPLVTSRRAPSFSWIRRVLKEHRNRMWRTTTMSFCVLYLRPTFKKENWIVFTFLSSSPSSSTSISLSLSLDSMVVKAAQTKLEDSRGEELCSVVNWS